MELLQRINTQNFDLNEIEQADIQNIHRGLSDPRVVEYYAVNFPTLAETQEQMDWYANLKRNGTGIWFGIFSRDTGEFCGAGGFNGLVKEHFKAEIGFWLLPEFWGCGIMAEVMPEIIKFGFEKLDLHRIEGFVHSKNFKCKKALEKIDFQYEGTMRDCEFGNGEFTSIDIYASIRK